MALGARSNVVHEDGTHEGFEMMDAMTVQGLSTTDMLSGLPPPPPFRLRVSGLTIGTPPPAPMLPLPIPIPVPSFLLRPRHDANGPKAIISNVSAYCNPGEMLAIIGGSGSGKTTLLHSIVGRLANLPVVEGDVIFERVGASSAPPVTLDSRHMKDRIGFVRQNDYLLPHLTVRETLYYAASLRLPSSVSSETRNMIINETIDELGLRDAADTVVGGLLRKGISGGEKRRLSIGCVLVTLPSVLCLDEPTTGLDAFTAYSLLLTLSKLAKRNRTVILSIHQPRSDAYALFSRLVLLSRGNVVYSGPRHQCLPWFASLDMVPPEGMNVLDWMIDISSVDLRTTEKEEATRARLSGMVEAWKGSATKSGHDADKPSKEDEEYVEILSVEDMKHPNTKTDLVNWDSQRSNRPGIFAQARILIHRSNKNVYRNYGQMIGFACQAVIIGILLGISFYRLEETPSGIQSLKTLSYQHLACYFYLTLIYTVFQLCEESLVVFDREREDHLYSVPPYILSEFVANLPVHVFFTAIFAIIVYFLCGLRTDNLAADLFIFIAADVLVQLCTVGFSLIAASLQRVYATASLLANASQIFLLLTAGYLLLSPPVYIKWIRWISMYFYSFRVVAISQFRDRTFTCEGVTGVALNQCNGNNVLAGLNMPTDKNVGFYFCGLIGLFIAEYIIAGIILHFYRPGGVKYAAQIEGIDRGKDALLTGDLDIPWAKVDVEVRNLGLNWRRRSLGPIVPSINKAILDDVNICFPAGQVTAILGPSGAGKSTLLQLIASRPMNPGPFASFESQGVVLFNGQPVQPNMRNLVAFVEQDDDHHYAALTVRETLRYAAILRLPRTVPRKRKIARAEEVLQMLGLSECANTLVGGPLLKGISGGEKRRLSLAVQMISDPSILIVDEPTSGLDSLTARNVMIALKQIAEGSGRTVIVTLHQPRSDIYLGLDNVVVLVKGGRVAYSGPRNNVGITFSDAGYPIPALFNPADHLLDTVSYPERAHNLLAFWSKRRVETEKVPSPKVFDPINADLLQNSGRRAPIHIALPVVVDRMVKNLWRQQPVFWVRLQQAPLLALIFWFFYQRLTHGADGGQDRIGFVQEFVLPIPFVGLLNGIAIYPTDRDLFLHEYQSSAGYSSGTFLLAFTIVELPLQILSSLLYTVIMNVGAGMQTSARIFFEAATVTFLLQSFGESLGIAFASITRSMGLNVSLVSTAITILCQISGIVSVSIPKWLSILAWGMVMKFGARVIMTNELVGLRLNCPPSTITSGECLGQTGEQLLELVGFRDLRTGRFLGIMVALGVLNRFMAWMVLRIKLIRLS